MLDKAIDTEKAAAELPVVVCSPDAALRDKVVRQLEVDGLAARVFVPPKSGMRIRCRALVVDVDGTDPPVDTLVSAVRSANPAALVISFGTRPDAATLIRLMRAGCADFLEKPMDAARLASRVRSLLERNSISRLSAAVTRRLSQGTSGVDDDSGGVGAGAIAGKELDSVNEQLHKAVSQIKTLYQMGRDLADSENWSDALDRFLMALVNFMEADGAALLLFSNYESTLRPRSAFQIDGPLLARACETIVDGWNRHPRSGEVHTLERYTDDKPGSCLERGE